MLYFSMICIYLPPFTCWPSTLSLPCIPHLLLSLHPPILYQPLTHITNLASTTPSPLSSFFSLLFHPLFPSLQPCIFSLHTPIPFHPLTYITNLPTTYSTIPFSFFFIYTLPFHPLLLSFLPSNLVYLSYFSLPITFHPLTHIYIPSHYLLFLPFSSFFFFSPGNRRRNTSASLPQL